MSWPLASHFSAMLQNPRIAFRDPELRGCSIEKDNCNQPRPWSGAFAVVYKGIAADGSPFAVRVFTTESPERRERYDFISEYLKTRRLNCLVDFDYRDESIRSAGDGKWYPLIIMDWVDGQTLFKWAGMKSLAGDGQALATAAAGWVQLTKELSDANLAHGDLQHANVMVTQAGQLKLVDYDCMCVPALVGRRNLEVGVEPYQHPTRNETTHLSLDLDSFSALVIYVAMRALAVDPTLWVKYVERPSHDKLLFRREDFQAPAASPLFRDLARSPEADVRELAEKLVSLGRVAMDQVPTLAQLTNSYAKVEELLVAKKWDAAVKLLNRRGQFRDAPEQLKPLIHQAYEHVCRQRAWDAFRAIPDYPTELNDRKLVNAWNEALFAGFEPAERQRPRVTAARRNVAMLDRIHHLVQQSSAKASLDQEQLISITCNRLPKDYRYSLQARVEQANHRVAAIRKLKRALDESRGEAAIAGAWQAVLDAQGEHLVEGERRPRLELARQRAALLEKLGQIHQDLPPDQLDRRLLDAWKEELVDGCEEFEDWLPIHNMAVHRKALLDRIQQAIHARDDLAIARLIEEPSLVNYGFPASWTAAIRAASDSVTKTEALIGALRDGDRSAFPESFDARLIRKFSDRFAQYESRLSEWTRSEILPTEALGLSLAVARASLFRVDKVEGTYRVRWTWPQQRFADECILAICPEQPGEGDDPRDLEVLHRLPIDRQNWESGGGSRIIHVEPEWAGCCVAVWAMVDLGFRLFSSHPLVLGHLDGQKRRPSPGWKGWKVLPSLRGGKRPAPKIERPAQEPQDDSK